MYEVWKIERGTSSMVDLQRDPAVAKQHVLEQSRLSSAVFYVARQGFGAPLYFVLDGVIGDPAEVMRRMGAPNRPEPLRFEPAGVIEDVEPFSAPNATEEAEVSEAPKPRRGKRGPSEVKGKAAGPSVIKQFDATITDVEDAGIVSAVVNVFGIIDDGLDIVHPGAFTKTLAENGHRVRVLDSHNNRSALNVVGRPLEIREIGRDELPPQVLMRHPEATGGLFTRTQFLLNTPEGKGIFERIKSGALNEYSIGFDALDTDMTKVMDPQSQRDVIVRNIRTARLWEYSVCTFGLNDQTTTVDVKAAAPSEGKPYGVFSQGDEYCVYKVDEDGQRTGESLGCHESEESAHQQIAAIEANEGGNTTLRSLINGYCETAQKQNQEMQRLLNDAILGSKTGDKKKLETLTARLGAMRSLVELGLDMLEHDSATEHKVGRVLSAHNFQALQQAAELLNAVLSSASLNDGDEPGEDDASKSQHDEHEHKHTPDGPQDAPVTPTSREEAGPLSVPNAPAVSTVELQSQIAQFLTDMEGQS